MWSHLWRATVRREKECACARTVTCCLHTARRVHGSRHCLDAKLPESTKNLRSAQDYKWSPDSGELENNWDLFALTSPYKSPCTSLCVTLALSLSSLIPPFFVLPLMVPRWRTPPRSAFCPCWGWRWEKYVFQFETQPFQVLLDCGIQHVILSCPQMHWNLKYSFALSSLKADKSMCSCLFIGIDASHVDCAFISWSLSERCIMTDVNLGDAVEVLDPLVSPTVYKLRRSVYFVVLPSVQCRGVFAAFQYSFLFLHWWLFWWSCCHGLLPLFFPLEMITEGTVVSF